MWPLDVKLDGVAGEIGDHLADARAVSDEVARRPRGVFEKQLDLFVAGLGCQQVDDFLDHLAQVESIRLDLQAAPPRSWNSPGFR